VPLAGWRGYDNFREVPGVQNGGAAIEPAPVIAGTKNELTLNNEMLPQHSSNCVEHQARSERLAA